MDFGPIFSFLGAGVDTPLGYYVVGILTGDVWEINECMRYRFPVLQCIQKSIMKQTGKTMADEKVHREGLGYLDTEKWGKQMMPFD